VQSFYSKWHPKENLKRKLSMKIFKVLFFTLLSAAIFLPGPSQTLAQAPKAPVFSTASPPARPPIPDLTRAQHEQIEALQFEFQKAVFHSQNEINEKEARLHSLTTQEEVDMKAVNRTLEEIGDLQTGIRKLHIQMDMQIRELLDERQRLIFDGMLPPPPPPPGFN
jgi:hypothetical protein